MKKSTFELSLFLGTIGVFIPIVIQIIYSKYSFLNLDTNLIVMQYLFLPGIYFICSGIIYFRNINNNFLNKIIVLDIFFIGISLILFAYMDKIDNLNLILQNIFFSPIIIAILFLTYSFLPILILTILIFYDSFKQFFKLK